MSRLFLQLGHGPQRTDWLAGAAGFEPLHTESEFAKALSPGGRTRTCASRIKDARAALLTKVSGARSTPRSYSGGMKFSRSDFEMQRFESRRPSRRVRSLRVGHAPRHRRLPMGEANCWRSGG